MSRILSGPERLAMLATEHAGCSAHVDQDRYVDVVVRPSDRAADRLEYYVGRHPPNSSVLFALGLYRLAGLADGLLTAPSRIGTATANLYTIAHGHGAWVEGPHVAPFAVGDVWVVVGPAFGVHVGVCVSDAQVLADGSWLVDTVEGGQFEVAPGWPPNSSAVHAFNGPDARQFVWRDGALSLGTQFLYGVVCADAMGVEPTTHESSPYPREDSENVIDSPVIADTPVPTSDSASVAAAKELPIAPVPARIASVRVRKGKHIAAKEARR
ncbi:MAG: hypothetical protein ABTD50_16460 [Polyangiaceae bacterium]|jgi:hypothetical protein